ncbi:MAG TPA: lysyl oxidase family protein [Anaerolineales bacterium]|nr:lysyl oxidase family protein [Anaerolineales bacterium]
MVGDSLTFCVWHCGALLSIMLPRLLCYLQSFGNRHYQKYVPRVVGRLIILVAWLGGWPIPSVRAALLLDSDPKAEVRLLLPDLQTLPPFNLDIRQLPNERRVLRLANTIWNSGQGPLELLGEFNPITRKTSVQQRLHATDKSTHDLPVGEFVWHVGHTHWHFEDFALYQLWSLTPSGKIDRVVSSSAKLSYCLIDTDIVDREHPNFAGWPHYWGCNWSRQGLSVGWGDTYDSFLDGQSLDVTGLTDGVYALTSTANPNNNLLEADYTNNTTVIYLKFIGNQVNTITLPEIDTQHCRDQDWC